MAARHSAGILLYRQTQPAGDLEVLLVHPGGPFWARKDDGAWSIPKGEYDPTSESARHAALREFTEELGVPEPDGELVELGVVTQRAGKTVTAFCIRGDLDTTRVCSNTFTTQWPPRSGQQAEFPEVDRAEWFTLSTARVKLLQAQVPLLDALHDVLATS